MHVCFYAVTCVGTIHLGKSIESILAVVLSQAKNRVKLSAGKSYEKK
jgi:hypothetical protein